MNLFKFGHFERIHVIPIWQKFELTRVYFIVGCKWPNIKQISGHTGRSWWILMAQTVKWTIKINALRP